MSDQRHCVLLLGRCDNRARCGWNCMLLANELEAPRGEDPKAGKPNGEINLKARGDAR